MTEKTLSLANLRSEPSEAPDQARRRRWLFGEMAVAAGAVGTTLGLATIVMETWRWPLNQPKQYNSDTLLGAMLVKDILHHGWYFTNPSLGAPFGQQLYDYPPSSDNLHLLVIKGLGLFSANAFVVINLFFILSFVLVTLSAYIVLRALRVSRVVSAGVSVLYALLPYHFFRGEMHLLLSAYYAVPLAVLLVVWTLDQPSLLWRVRTSHSGRLRLEVDRRRGVAALVCCVILGMTDGYYTIFAVVVLLGCGLLVAIGRRGWKNLATAAALVAIILVVLVLNLIPTLVYHLAHGTNDAVAQRLPFESELYGLKIARLFLPVSGHRIGILADLSARYKLFPVEGEASEALGVIFGVGLVAVLARGLAGRFRSTSADWRGQTLNSLALAALVAVFFGAMTGLSGIVALLITPQFRSWSRISVLIAFCAAAGLGLLLDQLFSRLPTIRSWWLLPTAGMTALVVIGVLDQTTTQDVPDYRYVSYRMGVNGSFMQAVQRRLPAGAMVFQLPYMAFPENGAINDMQDYEPVQGYVLSDGLRWSYGAMRGRPEDWQPALLRYASPQVIRAVAVAGFDAVYVDRTGYSDHGASIDQVLHSLVGMPVVESSDHLLELYDLRPLAAALRQQFPPSQVASMADAALHQVGVQYGSGFYDQETNGTDVWRWATSRAVITLSNPASHPETVVVQGTLATGGAGSSTVTITGPGTSLPLTTSPAGTQFSIELRVPPGGSSLRLSTDAPRAPGDARDIHVRLLDPQFRDPDLAPLQG